MPYWMVPTGEGEPGINGGLLSRQHPSQLCANTIAVADVDASVATVL
jgi:uncharacterized protein